MQLLDVNILIALTWPNHTHHEKAHTWFKEHSKSRWATCPVTESGFVRVSSNPKLFPDAVSPAEAICVLKDMTSLPSHVFWPDDLEIHNMLNSHLIFGTKQITDAYLLCLAHKHGSKFLTFDKAVQNLLSEEQEKDQVLQIIG